METLKFKTNINCGGCLKSVTPHLNELDHVDSWRVDIDNPDKILTVETNNNDAQEIILTVRKAGFEIDLMDEELSSE